MAELKRAVKRYKLVVPQHAHAIAHCCDVIVKKVDNQIRVRRCSNVYFWGGIGCLAAVGYYAWSTDPNAMTNVPRQCKELYRQKLSWLQAIRASSWTDLQRQWIAHMRWLPSNASAVDSHFQTSLLLSPEAPI